MYTKRLKQQFSQKSSKLDTKSIWFWNIDMSKIFKKKMAKIFKRMLKLEMLRFLNTIFLHFCYGIIL